MNNIENITNQNEKIIINKNKDFFKQIENQIFFYKDTIGIILYGNEVIFDKKQIGNFKNNYNQIENNAIQFNKELLNEKEFIELSKIFYKNIEILKELLNINNDYIWGENGLIFNLSNNWNSGHIQANTNSNKKMFRLGTIYKNKKL